jgi:hypothetical protein
MTSIVTTEDSRFAQIRERVTEWLLADGIKVSPLQSDTTAWLVTFKDGLYVGQPSGRPDLVCFGGVVTLCDLHRRALDDMDAGQREDFLWDLRFELLRLGVTFNGLSHPLRQVYLSHRLYWEGVRKNDFLDRVALMHNASNAVHWSIVRRLNQPAPPEPEPDLKVH